MKLADKIRYLREVEGNLRGLGRAMTQQELVRAIQEESGATSDGGRSKNGAGKKPRGTGISQSYLSQIESGARPHLTNTTRLLLAKFFKVHPGYLVDDPEGYQAELMSDARNTEDKLDLWLVAGAERFRKDPALSSALLTLANHDDSRRCLLLLKAVLDTPGLVDRLCEALSPQRAVRPQIGSVLEGQRHLIAKQDEASRERSTAQETATTSLQASAMRSRKGAARRTR